MTSYHAWYKDEEAKQISDILEIIKEMVYSKNPEEHAEKLDYVLADSDTSIPIVLNLHNIAYKIYETLSTPQDHELEIAASVIISLKVRLEKHLRDGLSKLKSHHDDINVFISFVYDTSSLVNFYSEVKTLALIASKGE